MENYPPSEMDRPRRGEWSPWRMTVPLSVSSSSLNDDRPEKKDTQKKPIPGFPEPYPERDRDTEQWKASRNSCHRNRNYTDAVCLTGHSKMVSRVT